MGKVDLILGDCLQKMKSIPDKIIDLVITSPPFNLGNNHHTGDIRHNPYDDDLPEEMYQQIQSGVLGELFRILTDKGSVLYQHKNRIKGGVCITPYNWILKTGFILKQELVWFNGSQNFDKIRFYPMTERVYWLAKDKKTQLENTINHHDLFHWSPEGTDKEHTRSFPVALATDLIQCFPNSKTILDPFMGSGTTGVACVKLDRNFIGIEIDPKYFEIAKRRIEEEQAKLKLF